MTDHIPTRSDEIKAIHHEYKFFYQVLGGSLLVAMGILIGAIAFSSELDRSAYFINLYTSLLSILVTVFVIDFLNRRREEHRERRQLQEQLIRDAGSTSNEIAKNAIHQLAKQGWLEGDTGLLKGADLVDANLEKAYMRRANLERTILHGANLEKADLGSTNLQRADLSGSKLRSSNLFAANLQGADLSGARIEHAMLKNVHLQGADLSGANLTNTFLREANLEGVDFSHANLTEANLRNTNLKRADLSGANMQGAKLIGTMLNETTILPNGSHWTPDTDLTKFGCIIE